MGNSEKGRNRKRNRKNENLHLTIALVIILLIALGAAVFLIREKKILSGSAETDAPEASVSTESLKTAETAELAGAEETVPDSDLSAEAETAPAEAPEVWTEPALTEAAVEGTTSLTDTAAEGTTSPTDTAAEGTTSPTDTAAEGTTPPVLENLDDYKPGDVIPREQFDFDNYKKYFVTYEIRESGSVFQRINGRSYRKNNDIALSDLRYLQMPHYNFNGDIQLGEMIVNKAIAGDVVMIFEELFQCGYQIEKMYLIDNYWTGDGDSSDTNSVEHNNTSSFCYRESTGGGSLSRHALGMAIDINPQQNPYVSYSSGQPEWFHANANDYIARDTGLPHVITREDPACRLFKAYGFNWGGDWENPKDYQHFDKR